MNPYRIWHYDLPAQPLLVDKQSETTDRRSHGTSVSRDQRLQLIKPRLAFARGHCSPPRSPGCCCWLDQLRKMAMMGTRLRSFVFLMRRIALRSR